MEIKVQGGNILQAESDLAVLATFEDTPLPAEVTELLEPNDFRGRPNQTLLLYPRGALAPRRLLLVGLGNGEKASTETIRRASATAIKEAQKLLVSAVTIGVNGDLPLDPETTAQAFAEGIELGNYRFWRYRTGLSDEQNFKVEHATVFARISEEKARVGIANGQKIARGVAFARDLVNGPGYAMHPPEMGEEAVKLGQRLGLRVTVLDMSQLIEQGFGGILAVGKGSEHEPRFIAMEYGEAGKGTPTICLVGKGLDVRLGWLIAQTSRSHGDDEIGYGRRGSRIWRHAGRSRAEAAIARGWVDLCG